MGHFRMKLDTVETPLFIGHSGNRTAVSAGHQLEAVWQFSDLVAVTHPDLQHAVAHRRCIVLDTVEQLGMPMRTYIGMTELAQRAGCDQSSELHRHRKHAVTNAQHRDAEFVHQFRGTQLVFFVGAGVAAGQDDALEHAVAGIGAQPILAHVTWMNLAKHMRLADAPRNQLGNLGTEVKNENFLVLHC